MENIHDLKLENYIEPITDAIIKVIGEKYRDIFDERISNADFIPYNNPEGIKKYANYLLECKKYELFKRFFDQIGVDISRYRNVLPESVYSKKFKRLIDKYLGTSALFDVSKRSCGIYSFEDNGNLKDEQIMYLNDYFFNGDDIITEDNLDEFKKTKYYEAFYLMVQHWIEVFDSLKQEYVELRDGQVKEYLEYASRMEDRLDYIISENTHAVFEYIYDKLPKNVSSLLKKKYRFVVDMSKILGSVNDWFGFDYFLDFYDNYLLYGSEEDKKKIKKYRVQYFINIGFLGESVLDGDSNLDQVYEAVMNTPGIKDLIPSQELIKEVNELGNELIKRSRTSLILEDPKFSYVMWKKRYSEKTSLELARLLADTPVLVNGGRDDGEFVPLLFYTVRIGDGGYLDTLLIHELLHLLHMLVLSDDLIKSGFDFLYTVKSDDKNSSDLNKENENPYRKQFRINERFNETIVDIIAVKVAEVLHNEMGIYLIENKECVRPYRNRNTNSILRNILRPFVDKYFKYLNDVMIFEDADLLLNKIGVDNFNSLVDIINYVDYLVSETLLVQYIENQMFDAPIYKEYLGLLEKVMDIYDAMDKHSKVKKVTI